MGDIHSGWYRNCVCHAFEERLNFALIKLILPPGIHRRQKADLWFFRHYPRGGLPRREQHEGHTTHCSRTGCTVSSKNDSGGGLFTSFRTSAREPYCSFSVAEVTHVLSASGFIRKIALLVEHCRVVGQDGLDY